MVIWGHPSTTGFDSIDYYLSSQLYYRHAYQPFLPTVTTPVAIATESPLLGYAQDFFLEQLVQFDTLGFYFERPQLDIDLKKIGAAVVETPTDKSHNAVTAVTTGGVQRLSLHNDNTISMAEKLALTYRPPAFFKTLRSTLKATKSPASKQLLSLITRKTKHHTSIALIPQHMPKFHPHFDAVVTAVLLEVPNSVIVLVGNKKKFQWRRMLTARWREKLTVLISGVNKNTTANTAHASGHVVVSTVVDSNSGVASITNTDIINPSTEIASRIDTLLSRIIWLDSLTPSEYLTLLSVGDVMLDPFPFGGGVTTLESVAVCTPVVTLPSRQSVPQLAAGK